MTSKAGPHDGPPRRWPAKLLAPLTTVVREDPVVGWIVLVFILSQLSAIGWDLPGSYGWENDGIAPRDFFAGIAINLTPGSGHRYPLFHNLLLGLLCIPILLPAALAADEWTLPSLMEQILTVPVMTGCSLVAKLLAVGMASVSLLVLARIARRTVCKHSGRWAALWAATCLTFAYYGRVSNLDGPCLMWGALAMDRLLTVVETRKLRDYLIFGGLAGAAVATKDQAYAGFVLPGVLYVLLLPLRGDRSFGPLKTHYRYVALAMVTGALALGLLGGGLLNPTGFMARFSELTGGASQEWMSYPRTPAGVMANLRDIALSHEPFYWPWPVVALCWLGVVGVVMRRGGKGIRSRTFRLLPFAAGVSSVLFFTLVVGRCQHRFLLPFGFWLSYYGGVASAGLLARIEPRGVTATRVAQGVLAALLLWSAGHSLEVHLTQWGDARRQVEAYLQELPPGTVVETYGFLVHLPRFDVSETAPYEVQRVSRRPISQRNPLVGAKEIDAPYGEVTSRRPDVLIVPEYFARPFVPRELQGAAAQSMIWQRSRADQDAQAFFRSAMTDSLEGYEVAFVAEPELPGWARALGTETVEVNAGTGGRTWVLRRRK